MASYYQNPSYSHGSAPPEHLQQDYGFKPPAYDQQQRQPYRIGEEHPHQPTTAPHTVTYINVQPAPVAQQPRTVIVQAQQPEEEDESCCPWLCCWCFAFILEIICTVAFKILMTIVFFVGIGLTAYFLKKSFQR